MTDVQLISDLKRSYKNAPLLIEEAVSKGVMTHDKET